jgi:hypothetical protein
MIAMRSVEKCYYCENPAEFTQLVGEHPDEFAVSGVCKKHFVMDSSS